MTKLRLKFVHSYRDRHGTVRRYFRRHGRKRIVLPGLPGSSEFMAAYQAALAGDTAPRIEIGTARSKPGSVSAAVAAYLGSTDFGRLAYATKRDRRLILERFRESHGERNFAALERKHVEIMLGAKSATPHAARNFLKALRAVVAVAIRIGLRDDNPTTGIRVKVRASADGFRTWSEDDISQFEAFYPIGSRARLAFGLLLHTAQRRGDVIRMGRQDVKGGFLTVRQGKTGAVVQIPTDMHPDLPLILAASGADRSNWFGALCRAAGLPLGLSAHGLRKAWCRRAAEAGCTTNQIAAITGHATLREVGRYTKQANQKQMAIAAMEAIKRTGIGYPASEGSQTPTQVFEKKGA